MSEVRSGVVAFFRDTMKLGEIDETQDLVDDGIVDSLVLVELLFFLEQRFGVRVDVSTLELNNFRTLPAICALVHQSGESAGDRTATQP